MPKLLADHEPLIATEELPLIDFSGQGLFIVPGVAIIKETIATLVVERQAVGFKVANQHPAAVPAVDTRGLSLELDPTKRRVGRAHADPGLCG